MSILSGKGCTLSLPATAHSDKNGRRRAPVSLLRHADRGLRLLHRADAVLALHAPVVVPEDEREEPVQDETGKIRT